MKEMPYVDKQGRILKFGEFFPPTFLLLLIMKLQLQDYFPRLVKKKHWKKVINGEKKKKNYKADDKSY